MYESILKYPDERLLTACDPVDGELIETGELFKLIGVLKMHLARATGIGLAANQIGGDRRVILVALPGEEYVMVNPEITKRRGETMSIEGCLSIPDEYNGFRQFPVVRPKAIKVKFLEPVLTGKMSCSLQERTIKASGLLAACICHEVDHLDGITLMERSGDNECLAS